MATKPSSNSALPWIWVIETLASCEDVDLSVIIDLVKRTSEISDGFGKTARERISLRILENLFAERNRCTIGDSAEQDSKIVFDPSEHCEDVLLRILSEMTASNLKKDGPEMLKWDVHPFIMYKKACMPSSALHQLKSAILKGSHPILAHLKERSGLATKVILENTVSVDDANLSTIAQRHAGCDTDSQVVASEGNLISPIITNENDVVQDDLPDRTLSLSKRDRSEAFENRGGQFYEDEIMADDACDSHLNAAKKLKQGITCTSLDIGERPLSNNGNELLDSPGRIRQDGETEGFNLARNSQLGNMEQSSFLEEDPDDHIGSKKLGETNDVKSDDHQHKCPQSSSKVSMASDSYGDGQKFNIPVVETKDDECSGVPLDVSHQNISTHEVEGNCEQQSEINTSNGACQDKLPRKSSTSEAKADMEHNGEAEASSESDEYHDDKIDIDIKKRTFLTSHCTFSQDSLATFDLTETNLCMKCNKSGQLLVCSSHGCPIGVHESCLVSAASFDEKGNFYCPFCACSHAISEYLELKKKASQARKDLASFIALGYQCQPSKHCKRSHSTDINGLGQVGDVERNEKANNNNNNEVHDPLSRKNLEHEQVEPSAACGNDHLSCGGDVGVKSINTAVCIPMKDNSEREKLGKECQSARVIEIPQLEVQPDRTPDDDNLSCGDTETVHVNEEPSDVGVREVVSPQPSTGSPCEAASTSTNEAEGSSEENDSSTTSKYSIRYRKGKKQYYSAAIPQLRRKKVPWNKMEEKMIKVGVSRFSSRHDRTIPWKMILEFGGDVFQKGRTTGDLKDKWRNMCKGSPNSK